VLIGGDADGTRSFGRVRVADFGLARVAEAADDERDGDVLSRSARVTRTGATMGTPAYMAPEQGSRHADARSDQYAFCVALHEALYGVRPRAEPARAPSERSRGRPRRVPGWLAPILRRGLARAPSERHADMRALIVQLEQTPRRRRRIAIATASAIAASAWAWLASTDPRCDGASDDADAIWTPARAEAIASAWAQSDFPGAVEASTRLDGAMQSWREAWRGERHEACVATRERGEQSEARLQSRIDCLARLRRRVELLAAAFEHADNEAIVRADAALAAIAPPATCEDPETFAGDVVAEVDRPAYDSLRERLDGADTQHAIGQGERVRSETDAIAEAAHAAGFLALAAEAELLAGRIALQARRQDDAIAKSSRAMQLAWEVGDERTGLQAMRHIGRSLADRGTATDESLRWLDAAEARARHAGWGAADMLELEHARSHALYLAERNVEAEAAARRMLALVEEHGLYGLHALTALGHALTSQRRFVEAIAAYEQAIALGERLRGPDHPDVRFPLEGLGQALKYSGEPAAAIAAMQRAVAIAEGAFGPSSAVVAEHTLGLASAQIMAGDVAGSLASYERTRTIIEQQSPRDDTAWVMVVRNMMETLYRAGQTDRVLADVRAAFPVAQRVYGESVLLAEFAQDAATTEAGFGDPKRALEHGKLALRLYERFLGPTHPRIAGAYMAVASVQATAGDFDEALRLLDLAETAHAAGPEPLPRERAYLHAVRAETLAAAGKREDALAPIERAVAAFERLNPDGHPDLAQALSIQGGLLIALGRNADAERVLVRALAMVSAETPELQDSIAARLASARAPR
ncbi:MAG TPA: tetratricopeptide repeat-containing protein kinase family protein, partial [Nannocystaceae bacterium]|nr:tetratricopeptide repeat-containing protein kinase family protein [Nannocystaceae bacterium]